MNKAKIDPSKITMPFQLLAAWWVALILIISILLTAALKLNEPMWLKAAMIIATIIIIVIFIFCIFRLQTKFRDQMMPDREYFKYVMLREDSIILNGVYDSIMRASKSNIITDKEKVVKNDIPKLGELSGLKTKRNTNDVSNIRDSAEAKLKYIYDSIKENPYNPIRDYIFVSGTYGYNVWRTEMEWMLVNGWIEIVDDTWIKLTEKGVDFAKTLKHYRAIDSDAIQESTGTD
jgi:hypothetical protein